MTTNEVSFICPKCMTKIQLEYGNNVERPTQIDTEKGTFLCPVCKAEMIKSLDCTSFFDVVYHSKHLAEEIEKINQENKKILEELRNPPQEEEEAE